MDRRYQQNPAIEAATLEQGLMLLEPEARKFCALNATSSLIWSKLEQASSTSQIAEAVTSSFSGISSTEALSDVEAIVMEMAALGLVILVE